MFNTSAAALLKRFMAPAPFISTASRALAGAILLLSAMQQSGATTVLYKGFNDLIAESDAIISGRVAKIESTFSNNKEDIYTFVTLDSIETLSGSYSAPSVTLRFLGGQVGNDILNVSGSPSFKPNERVIVFVHGNGRNMVPVVGWTQGVFRIGNDTATGQQVVTDHDGNRVFGLEGGAVIKERIHQPEATIVHPQGIRVGASQDVQSSAGSADFIAPAAPAGPPAVGQQTPLASQPPMPPAAFVSAIKRAAQSRRVQGTLRSAGPGDPGVPSDNRDASTGPNTGPVDAGGSQEPVLPKPAKPEAPAVEQ